MLMNATYRELPRYGVIFVGYGARIVRITQSEQVGCAMYDFVSGATIVNGDEGWLLVSKRLDLTNWVGRLPQYAEKLKTAQKDASAEEAIHLKLVCGENEIMVNRATNVDRFLQQITERYLEIGPLLDQVETVGSKIARRPYAEYIDEIARTGVSRVVRYGFGEFVAGQMRFYPARRTLLVKQSGRDDFAFQIAGDRDGGAL